MPSGTRRTQLCSGSKFAPRTRGSTSNRNWLFRSCARRSVARISIVPSPPPLLDCSVEFFINERVANRIELIALFCLFRQLHIALGQMFPFTLRQRALFPCRSVANFLREMAIFLSTGHFLTSSAGFTLL